MPDRCTTLVPRIAVTDVLLPVAQLRVYEKFLSHPLFSPVFFVLLIPFVGRLIWPLAIAGLGFKYFGTNSLDRFGHPCKKPFRNAFIRHEIFGLHND